MRGHNIAADGWAGASNPQPHPNHTHNPPPTHSHTNNTNCSILNTRFSRFQLERDNSSVTDGPADQRTDGPTDRWTDKASYRVAGPQLKTWLSVTRNAPHRKSYTWTVSRQLQAFITWAWVNRPGVGQYTWTWKSTWTEPTSHTSGLNSEHYGLVELCASTCVRACVRACKYVHAVQHHSCYADRVTSLIR